MSWCISGLLFSNGTGCVRDGGYTGTYGVCDPVTPYPRSYITVIGTGTYALEIPQIQLRYITVATPLPSPTSTPATSVTAGATVPGATRPNNGDNHSTGTKTKTDVVVPIAVVVPVVVIGLVALVIFLYRRKKGARVGKGGQRKSRVDKEFQEPGSGLMVAAVEQVEEDTHPKPELASTVATLPSGIAPGSYPQTQHSQTQYPPPSQHGANELYSQHGTSELHGVTATRMHTSEPSNHDRWSQAQELHSKAQVPLVQELCSERGFQSHDLGTTNASSVETMYSDDRNPASNAGDRAEQLEALKERRAVVVEERERLRRMELLKEEDERLEREIAEIERMRQR
jgi:hypothetical protein